MLVSLKCPNCNGDVQLDNSREFGFCVYCGTKILNERSNESIVKIDERNKLINILKTAKRELELHHEEVVIKLLDDALYIDADCKDALLIKALLTEGSNDMRSYRTMAEKGNSYDIFTEQDYDSFSRLIMVADKELKKEVRITIVDTEFEIVVAPGEYAKLPCLKGERRIVIKYKGNNTLFRTRTDIEQTFLIKPPLGFGSGLVRVFPIDGIPPSY